MASKRKGLGRGLDTLLGSSLQGSGSSLGGPLVEPGNELELTDTLKHIPVDLIRPGKYQPRRDIQTAALEELADSIKVQGVMQPIVVRPISDEKYEIIAGERRWRATQLAGLDTVPAIIRDVPDEAVIAMALIENIQREDLNPIEEALALKQLQDEFELTHQQVAHAVGKSRAAVTNLLRLVALDEEVKKLLEHGDLEMGHARAVLSLAAEQQRSAAHEIVAKDMSVRQTEMLVRRMQQQQTQTVPKHKIDPDTKKLQEGLAEKIGVPVSIEHNAKGKGKLVLKYSSLDELEGILAHLQYQQ